MNVAPYHASAVTEGRRKYSSNQFATWARDWDEWWQSRPGRINPGKNPLHIVQEAGLASGPVWTDTENLTQPGFDALTVKPVAVRSLYIPASSKEVSACFVPL
jgi:hypothetical protein